MVTETAEGRIPHRMHPTLKVEMPVKLERMVQLGRDGQPRHKLAHKLEAGGRFPVPMRDSTGKLIFALPGGGNWIG